MSKGKKGNEEKSGNGRYFAGEYSGVDENRNYERDYDEKTSVSEKDKTAQNSDLERKSLADAEFRKGSSEESKDRSGFYERKFRSLKYDVEESSEIEGKKTGRGLMRFASNFLTSLNLFSGFLAIFFAFEGKAHLSFYLIIFGLIFDMADGRIARALNISSRFGLEFDSLADLVTFGLAPSAIIYNEIFKTWEFGKILAFIPTLAVAIRLARYNVYSTSDEMKGYFLGLSSPMGAFIIVSSLMTMKNYELLSSIFGEIFFICVVFGIASLQVSSIKFRSFKEVKIIGRFFPYLLFLPPFFLWLAIFKTNIFFLVVLAGSIFYIIYNLIYENIFHSTKSKKTLSALDENDELKQEKKKRRSSKT